MNDDLQSTSSIFSEQHPSVAARSVGARQVRVPAMTLASLVARHAKGREVAFLKIDAEGAEGAIIRGGDWTVCRPRIVLAESTEPFSTMRIDAAWVIEMDTHGYAEAYFDGINTWFVRKENPEDFGFFKVPVNVLDDFVRFDPKLMKWQLSKAQQSAKGTKLSGLKKLRLSLAKRIASIADVVAP